MCFVLLKFQPFSTTRFLLGILEKKKMEVYGIRTSIYYLSYFFSLETPIDLSKV